MTTGTIARILNDKGFGFIRSADGLEYFFHRSAVTGAAFEDLRVEQAVTFEQEASARGPRASRVVVS